MNPARTGGAPWYEQKAFHERQGVLRAVVTPDGREGTLTIGQSGEAHAQLEGRDIYINGLVHGNLRGDKVRLDSQARVVGDINSHALSISEGAVFQGNCSMEVDGAGAGEAEAEPDEGEEGSVIPMDGRRASGS